MLINEVKNDVNNLASKNNSGGYLPEDVFTSYCSLAQLNVINTLYDALDHNLNVMTLLSVVLKEVTKTTDTSGLTSKPTDYYKFVAASALVNDGGVFEENEINYIGRSERASQKRSKIVSPTIDYPIISEIGNNLQVDPQDVRTIKLTYVYQPEDPVWASDGNVPPVFDPGASTDFVLGNQFKDILVNRIAMYFGIEIRDPNLQQATVQNLIGSIK